MKYLFTFMAGLVTGTGIIHYRALREDDKILEQLRAEEECMFAIDGWEPEPDSLLTLGLSGSATLAQEAMSLISDAVCFLRIEAEEEF